MVPGIPGMRLPPKETRPPFSNPPPREIVVSEVRASYGKASFTGPGWAFIALLIFGLLATIVYLASRRQPEDPTGIAHDVRGELSLQTEEMRKLRTSLTDRIDKLDTKVDRLQDSQDRVRERVTTVEQNADQAHHDSEGVRNLVLSLTRSK